MGQYRSSQHTWRMFGRRTQPSSNTSHRHLRKVSQMACAAIIVSSGLPPATEVFCAHSVGSTVDRHKQQTLWGQTWFSPNSADTVFGTKYAPKPSALELLLPAAAARDDVPQFVRVGFNSMRRCLGLHGQAARKHRLVYPLRFQALPAGGSR